MTGWPELRPLIHRGDTAAVAAALHGLDAGQRKELEQPLREYERQFRADPRPSAANWARMPALAVAGAAILPNASAVAPWLARNSPPDRAWRQDRHPSQAITIVRDVLVARNMPWLGDLARRLAGRLPVTWWDVDLWTLVRDLVRLTGIEPPDGDAFVIGWADYHGGERRSLAAEIDREPGYAALIPRLFEIERVTVRFSDDSGWPRALAALAATGHADRAVLLDSCLGALQRGGRLGSMQGCLRVHDELAPSLAEAAARAGDYIALLPASHSVVAGMAQRELRRLDDEGELPVQMLRQVSDVLLARPEKTLVREQLGWLDAAARRSAPADARELVLAMATAFGQQAVVLQRRALTLTIRHAAPLDASARAELAEAAAALPVDLRADAAKAFGGGLAGADPGQAGPVLSPSAPARDLPPPIGSPAELAAEITSLYERMWEQVDPIALERVLAGVVETSAADRAALAAALERFLDGQLEIDPGCLLTLPDDPAYWRLTEYDELNAIVAMAVAPPVRPAGSAYPQATEVPGEAVWRARQVASQRASPLAWMVRRLHEIAVGLGYAPRPMLLSTPTTVSGLIDPAALVDRVRRAAAGGWEPWELDLTQALARLPRAAEPGLAKEANALATPAALRLARRLAAGAPPDPVVTRELRGIEIASPPYQTPGGTLIQYKMLAVVRSASAGAPDDPCALAGELIAPQVNWRDYPSAWHCCWPAMLPAHRDVIAAHVAPYLGAATGKGQTRMPLLPLLAQADGPVGTGMNLALPYGLGARDQADRAAAVDALITLAARGAGDGTGLNGAALGECVGTLAARGDLVLTRVVPALRDVARAGAYVAIWDLVAAALPVALSAEQSPHRLADLLELGVELAQACHPRAGLRCLDELAAKRGSSQLITQARRLRTALHDSQGL